MCYSLWSHYSTQSSMSTDLILINKEMNTVFVKKNFFLIMFAIVIITNNVHADRKLKMYYTFIYNYNCTYLITLYFNH